MKLFCLITFVAAFTLGCLLHSHPTVTPAPMIDGVPECEAR